MYKYTIIDDVMCPNIVIHEYIYIIIKIHAQRKVPTNDVRVTSPTNTGSMVYLFFKMAMGGY